VRAAAPRLARVAAVLAVLPLAGCILAVDHGGRRGLEKRIEKLEKRTRHLERERGLPEGGRPGDG
jgi:hypothetical protein